MADMDPPRRRARKMTEAGRRVNRNPRLTVAARRAREWAMGEPRLDSGLPSVRGQPADVAFRQLAALRVNQPGVAGELGAGVLQAWQRLAEAQGRGRGTADVTIMFSDIVGFSAWALEAGDRQAVKLISAFNEAIEPPVLKRRGEVVKRLGDGVMAAFGDPEAAIEAAFDAHERFLAVEVDGYVPQLRTGIHLGRPRKVARDYLGVDVNIAARLSEQAQPGEVLVSARLLQELEDGFVEAVEREFSAKGAPEDLKVHALRRAAAEEARA